jgi:hypothetical protein
MRRAFTWLLIIATLWSGACAPGSVGQIPTPASSPVPVRSSPVASVIPDPSSNPESQALVDAALRDAAAHLGVSPADLHVDRVEAREWGDSSLGCPRPGLMYSQIVTPGFVIVISAAGKQLEYHTDTRGQVVLCQER